MGKSPGRNRSAGAKRVCYLCLDSGVDVSGTKGASVHIRSVCEALASLGHAVTILSSRPGKGTWPGKSRRIRVVPIPIPKDFLSLRKSLRVVYGADLRLPSEVRQCAINREALPYLTAQWSRSRPDAVVERLSLMGVAGLRAARSLGIPFLLEVNALLSEEARAHRSLSDYEAARRAEDETLIGADRVFTVSALLRHAVIDRGVQPEKVEVLPNAFDGTRFRPRSGVAERKKLGLGNRLCIGMVGSMKAWHGVTDLLEAFRRLAARRRNCALVLVGDGPETSIIAAFRSRHPELFVLHTGAVAHTTVPKLVAAFDIAVAPYERNEKFYFSPMKMYEYLAMGKAVVASDQGQIGEIIQDGRNGLLYPAGSVTALVNRLGRLASNGRLRARLGKAARVSVRGRSWTANARRLLRAAQEVRS